MSGTDMPSSPVPPRCRLVLITPEGFRAADVDRLGNALAGGDVASVILPQYGLDETAYQSFAERLVPVVQEADAAAILAGDTRVASRVAADGIHFEGGKADLADLVARFGARMAVGAGGAKTRDDALELGEERPDYIFFGRFGYDNKPEPHPRNLSLGQWWAEMIELPCIVLGGSDVESVAEVAHTGAEFVALSAAVFGEGVDGGEAVRRANALLDRHAPMLEA